jgi:nucleoside-diphosphate-sugar epimerase
MTKILITGANSFLGMNYIRLSKFKDVEEVSLLERNPDDVNFSSYTNIIHLAAIVHQSKKIPEKKYFQINRDLCLKVAGNAKKAGVENFIFLSTVKVYGKSSTNFEPLNEDSPCNPVDPYGESKYQAEIGLKKLEDDKFKVSIIRTPLVYGDGVKANMYNILKLVDRFSILPFGKVNNKRSFTFVDNIVAYIDRIIEKKAYGTFIAMDENPLSTTELIKGISTSLGKKIYLFKVPEFLLKTFGYIFPGIISRLYGSLEFNNHKTLERLNFKPPFTSEEGIMSMVEAYLKTKGKQSLRK